MSYKLRDQSGLYFITSTIVGWIDLFIRKKYRDIIIDSLRYCQEHKALRIYAFIIMSNHIHLVVQAGRPDKWPLSAILRDFKKFTANTILDNIDLEPELRRSWLTHMFKYYAKYNTNNRVHQVWMQDNHPILLDSQWLIWQKINYIHKNPVVARIVDKPEDYVYSSARNYKWRNRRCILKINLMDSIDPEEPEL